MKKYAFIFICIMASQLIGMEIIEKQTKKLSQHNSLLSYDQLIADNACYLKYLVEKEKFKGSCSELNKCITVLLENSKKTYQDGYLSSRCNSESRRFIVRLTQRPHHSHQLSLALKQGSLTSIKSLCELNPLVINAYSLYSDYGCTTSPLHYMLWACEKKLKWKIADQAIRYLLDTGASPKGIDAEGNTPLHKARTMKHIILLLDRGACINAKNNEGLTPLMEYVRNQKQELALFLIKKRGADIWLKDNNKNTLLYYAVHAGTLGIIKHLLWENINTLTDRNVFGETPAQLICGSCIQIKKLVQEYMLLYMDIALDKNMHNCIEYIIEQFPWIDYTPLLMSISEEKVMILKNYLKINLIKNEKK